MYGQAVLTRRQTRMVPNQASVLMSFGPEIIVSAV